MSTSNKRSISWHEDCVKCMIDSLAGKKRVRDDLDASIRQLENEIAFLSSQIQAAKEQNKDGFDSERFLIKKKA